jgi:two-component system response regulator
MAEPQRPSRQHPSRQRPSRESRGAVILLIEDNPDDEELTVMALRDVGVVNEIMVAHDGAEALELLTPRSETGEDRARLLPDLVLLDLRLPKVSGLEVLRQLRAQPRTRLLPVVVLTTSRLEEDIVASYELGANSFVRKPVDFDRFTEAVRQLGLYWLLINEAPPPPSRTGR